MVEPGRGSGRRRLVGPVAVLVEVTPGGLVVVAVVAAGGGEVRDRPDHEDGADEGDYRPDRLCHSVPPAGFEPASRGLKARRSGPTELRGRAADCRPCRVRGFASLHGDAAVAVAAADLALGQLPLERGERHVPGHPADLTALRAHVVELEDEHVTLTTVRAGAG